MAFIDIPTGSDGNTTRVELPDWALDSTQTDMLKLVTALVEGDKKARKAYEKIVKETTDNTKQNKKDSKKKEKHNEEQIKTLKDLKKSLDKKYKDNPAWDFVKNFSTALIATTALTLKFGATLMGAGAFAAGALAKSTLSIGSVVSSLTQVGVGFDDMSGTAVGTIASLNRLGLTTDQAAASMQLASGAIQTLGKERFVDLNQQFAEMTNHGAEFGMVMADAVDILTDDLHLRQTLGILDKIDTMNRAKQSRELYKRQIEMASLLGKSVDEVRKGSQDYIADSAQINLKMMRIAAGAGEEMADRLLTSTQEVASSLRFLGVDAQIANQMINEMFDPVAFMSQGGQELFSVFTQLGTQGSRLNNHLYNVNQAYQSGDITRGIELMKETPEMMSEAVKKMTSKDFTQFSYMLQGLGTHGEAMAKSFGQMRQAAKNAEKQFEFPEIAVGAAQFENSINRLRGGVSSMLTDVTGSFGPLLTGLMSQMDGKDGILYAFSEGAKDFSEFMAQTFGLTKTMNKMTGEMEYDFSELGKVLKTKLLPQISRFFTWMKDLVDSFTGSGSPEQKMTAVVDKIVGFGSNVATAAVAVADFAAWVGKIIGWFFPDNKATMAGGVAVERGGVPLPLYDADRSKVEAYNKANAGVPGFVPHDVSKNPVRGEGENIDAVGTGRGFSLGRVLIAIGVISAVKLAVGAAVAASIGGLGKILGIGAGAKVAGTVGGAALGSGGAAATVKSLGARGALGAALASAIPIIAKATLVIGIISAGIGAFGLAVRAFPIDALGDMIAKIKLAGAESEERKLDARTRALEAMSEIPSERYTTIAADITTLSRSMSSFSESVGSDGFFGMFGSDTRKQFKYIEVFDRFSKLDAAAITSSSDAISKMATAYERFANLDGNMLLKNSEAIAEINKTLTPKESFLSSALGLLSGFGETEATNPAPKTYSAVAEKEKNRLELANKNDELKQLENVLNQIHKANMDSHDLLKKINVSVLSLQ